jgi:hypothetical protein
MIQLIGVLMALVGVLVGIGYAQPPVRRSGFFRIAGLVLMAVLAGFIGMFIVAEAVGEPGGWAAVGRIASWLVPLSLLVTLALVRPAWAQPVLVVLTGLVLLLHVWFMIDTRAWRSFEDDIGPVRAVAGFVVMVALAALGWHRSAPAGWLLLALGVPPVVLLLLETGRFAVASWVVVGIPGVAVGILYLLAADTASARKTSARKTSARKTSARKTSVGTASVGTAGVTTPRTPASPRNGPGPPRNGSGPPAAAPTRAVERNTP